MQKTLTPEKLVLYVYDEISDREERDEMNRAIRSDNDLYDEYCLMQESRDLIERSLSNPPEACINRLLNYSKALTVVHTKDHRTIELVMN